MGFTLSVVLMLVTYQTFTLWKTCNKQREELKKHALEMNAMVNDIYSQKALRFKAECEAAAYRMQYDRACGRNTTGRHWERPKV